MKRLAIIGAGGHGKVAADIALQSDWEEVCFFDDMSCDERLEHWPLVGDTQRLLTTLEQFAGVFVAIGNNVIRKQKLSLLQAHSAPITTLVHPHSAVSPFASLGAGAIVVAGAVINAFAKVGTGAVINSGATIGHDCILGDYVHVAPGANVAGGVVIGESTWVGIGSAIRQGICVGSGVTIAAGAIVVRNAQAGELLMGIPARPHNSENSSKSN